ncbi:DUF3180 domain-containing protein [Rhodococcus sp. BP-252]|uniref:DUF3180 domain-containing protein n=1 Tax=Rhodococcoides kyotonense TaxID=398843 RepID=A0A177YK15_9NOCA|nr:MULTISPECIES: DUF3180 domain-containing protein [Rhodococcus]MBY6413250.1 DUF3180 domain-containing protein [Rhodococcus sp. BP-320]MBY6418729.1 DUF3180 domain-containing protein [Rhodococcus sp. BP-321]MBY6423023.1 DUF3180 domain-containing protein [Rhodococcus sp. BP-324]MBY6427993.1 DUF3180 domain-containing protein [Rhodococcus sp. BP-323]MBY6433171.1 DUF3180 domain-containing protein [Rhodococcus sp. BP-322]
MKPTRVWDLIGLAVIAAVATWLLVRTFYGSLPPIPVYAGASLYPVALVETILAFVIRSRVDRRQIGAGPRQIHPITAARALALAKASALVGAAATGVWIGFLLHVMPMVSTVRAAASDRAGAIVGLVAGAALVGAALWLEHCCRTPDDSPDEPTP